MEKKKTETALVSQINKLIGDVMKEYFFARNDVFMTRDVLIRTEEACLKFAGGSGILPAHKNIRIWLSFFMAEYSLRNEQMKVEM